ncbi:MAG TPA: hypothetical protein VMI54_15735 [Polyangiaceae bacterium]|nr:hypothetical protein [Polyangiaceae bacterium]
MPEALHDPKRLVPPDGRPGRARRAEVVPAEALARAVGALSVQVGPANARAQEVVPQARASDAFRERRAHEPFPARLGVHGRQQGQELGLDAEPPRKAALRGLELAGAGAVDGLVHVNDGVLEVDVGPPERVELARPKARVDRERGRPPPAYRHVVALDEAEELRREQVALRLRRAAVRRCDVAAGVVVAHAEPGDLRAHGLAEHLRDQHPHVARGLPRELVRAHLRVERRHEPLDVGARDGRHLQAAELGPDVIYEAAAIVVRGRETAGLAVRHERAEPRGDAALDGRAAITAASGRLAANTGRADLLLLFERALAGHLLGRALRERREALLRAVDENDDALEKAGVRARLDADDGAD